LFSESAETTAPPWEKTKVRHDVNREGGIRTLFRRRRRQIRRNQIPEARKTRNRRQTAGQEWQIRATEKRKTVNHKKHKRAQKGGKGPAHSTSSLRRIQEKQPRKRNVVGNWRRGVRETRVRSGGSEASRGGTSGRRRQLSSREDGGKACTAVGILDDSRSNQSTGEGWCVEGNG